jgi:hypothetical protein
MDYDRLAEEIRSLAILLKCTQSTAVTVMGYIMKIKDAHLTGIEAYEAIKEITNTKKPDELDMDERLMCIALGILKRKTPFVSSANKIGRNESCPCNSGAKYKNCCLEMAKAHDYNRFYGSKQ